jgi:hypothetical protein
VAFGLPAGSSTDTLEFTLSLKNQAGGEVWTYSFLGDESIIQGLYYNNGDDTINFTALMETGMNKGLQELAPKLPQIVQDLGVRVTPTTP